MFAGESVINTSSDQIVLALIAVITLSMGALVFVIRNGRVVQETRDQVQEVNKAVNNVGPGEHRLYDKVDQTKEQLDHIQAILDFVVAEMKQHRAFWEVFHRKWGNFPEDMDGAVALALALKEIRRDVKSVTEKLDTHLNTFSQDKHHK